MSSKWILLAGLVVAFGANAPYLSSQETGQPQSPQQSATPLPLPAPSPALTAGAPSPFSGAVPSGQVTAEELPLSLTDAINRGLKNNLGQFLTQQGIRSARGEEWVTRSGLLPTITARLGETVQQVNLVSFGFSDFPGLPSTIIGPFGYFDARAFASQKVLDFSAISNARFGSENLKAANYSYQDARDIVVTTVASLYLQAIAGSSRIAAAQAQLNTAQALYNQAVSFKQSGVVPAIEVLRAQVELQARQQQLIFYQNEFEKQKLALARAIGLPVAQRFRLSDQLPYVPLPDMRLDATLEKAYRTRSDYQEALALVRASEFSKKALEEQSLPSVAVRGDYGDIGKTPNHSHGTFTAAASLEVPLFTGGRIHGDVLQADAQLQQQKARLEDLRSRIEYEVRTAFLDLKAAGDRVAVARSALDLAQQQMAQAQDRFGAGVTGNIEVVQAQEALATANENIIASTYAYNVAKTALARAIGGAENSYKQFLLGEK